MTEAEQRAIAITFKKAGLRFRFSGLRYGWGQKRLASQVAEYLCRELVRKDRPPITEMEFRVCTCNQRDGNKDCPLHV